MSDKKATKLSVEQLLNNSSSSDEGASELSKFYSIVNQHAAKLKNPVGLPKAADAKKSVEKPEIQETKRPQETNKYEAQEIRKSEAQEIRKSESKYDNVPQVSRTSKQVARREYEFKTDTKYKDILQMQFSDSSDSDGDINTKKLLGEMKQIISEKKTQTGQTLQAIQQKKLEDKVPERKTQAKEVAKTGLSGSKDPKIKSLIDSDSSSEGEDMKFAREIFAKADKVVKQALSKEGVAQKDTQFPKPKPPPSKPLEEAGPPEAVSDFLELVDQNERKQGQGQLEKALENSNSLLSFDNKYFNQHKRLLDYKEYSAVGKLAFFDTESDNKGTPTCLHVVGDHVFVGNSNGVIRVFNLDTQEEQMPLKDNSLARNKVTAISISQDRALLISGYKKGNLALWDLEKAKLIKVSQPIHGSDVVCVSIYFRNQTEQSVWVLSSEDTGPVWQTEFTKKSLFGYSVSAQCLFKSRLVCTASLVVRESDEERPFPLVDSQIVSCFGAINEIVICRMSPIKEIYSIKKPSFCQEKSLPYISFGFGLTPIMREKTVPLMAVAWDKLIQLYFFERETGLIMEDGIFYSDQEVTGIRFIGDSILLALIGGREVKILYTTKFNPESYHSLEKATPAAQKEQFEAIVQYTAYSVLEKGHVIHEIRPQVMHSQPVYNYNSCLQGDANLVVFMCSRTFQSGLLFDWKEYLEHIHNRESYDWLSVLKVALEIYNGEQRGYSGVPDEKMQREKVMRPFLKQLLKESIQQVVFQYRSEGQAQTQYEASNIALKVAIEFCVNIHTIDFLFTDLYEIFKLNGMEEKFLLTLEPFILAGHLRREILPHDKVRRLIEIYEQNQNYATLEKVIQNLNFSEYPKIDELQVICMSKTMVSALLYLMTKQKTEAGEWDLGCMQILNTIFKVFKDAQDTAKVADFARLFKVDTIRKQNMEKSKVYIGYKLLWTMKLSLEGLTFPYGELSYDNYRAHVYDISNFITTRDFLQPLMEFDPKSFFQVVILLFRGRPLHYLQTHDHYKKQSGSSFSFCQSVDLILQTLKTQVSQSGSSKPEIWNHFHKFQVQVAAGTDNDKEQRMLRTLNQIQSEREDQLLITTLLPIEQDYASLVEAINKSIQQNLFENEEADLIRACERTDIKAPDVTGMLDYLESQTKSSPRLRVHLLMRKKDYTKIYKIYLSQSDLKSEVFPWIKNTMRTIEYDIEQEERQKQKPGSRQKTASEKQIELLNQIEQSLKQLVSISVDQTIEIVSAWFEDKMENFIKDLNQHPRIQFDYLTKFLSQNEEKVSQSINSMSMDTDQIKLQALHKHFLILQTGLLCDFEPDKVHEFVKKDYYPVVECLEIVKQKQIHKAEAILLQRNGEYLSSVRVYMKILQQEIDELKLSQALMEYKQDQIFELNVLENKIAKNFDSLLDNSMKICQTFMAEIGSDGWFVVLQNLESFIQRSLSTLQNKGSKKEVERLKEFVYFRKDMVFGKVPLSVSLLEIADKLQMEFDQMKRYYDKRVTQMRDETAYIDLARSLLNKEHKQMRDNKRHEKAKGQKVEGSIGGLCQVCNQDIYKDRLRVTRVFCCDHAYHMACLKEHDSENRCITCEKQQLELMLTAEQKKKKRQTKKEPPKEPVPKGKQMAYDSALVAGLGRKTGENIDLSFRRLEAFDKVVSLDQLQIDSFQF